MDEILATLTEYLATYPASLTLRTKVMATTTRVVIKDDIEARRQASANTSACLRIPSCCDMLRDDGFTLTPTQVPGAFTVSL